jgi:hypothetical protein
MDIRDATGPLATGSPDVVRRAPTGTAVDRPVLRDDRSRPGHRSMLRRAVLLGVSSGAVLALVLGAWLVLRGDGNVGTTAPPVAARGNGVAPLTVTVDLPAEVVAGRAAVLVVHYADGKGTFSGSTEDWGDGVGTSSLAEGRCAAAATPTGPASGSYRASHTWAEAGSYPVSIAVSSYACVDGAPVEEQATTTVTVTVAAK